MTAHIKTSFLEQLPITLSPQLAQQLNRMVLQFEIRGEHPLTLNSQMFGVNKFVFTPDDRALFFDLIDLEEPVVSKVISKIPSIVKEFRVISDNFNLMSVYLAHLILNSSLPKKIQEETVIKLLNYMQYRFMSSAVNHYFPHGANYDIMQTVVESLSMKFSVKQHGTWAKVISSRSESIAYHDRAHKSTLMKFDNDKNILYLISDISTRIRSQLKIITSEYYSMKDANNFIRSHSSTTELDGEKIIREKESSFELMSSVIYHKILNRSAWVDARFVKMVQKSVPRLNTSIINRAILSMSDEAKDQMKEGTSLKIIKRRDGSEIYVGIEILVNKIVSVVYGEAIRNDRVNLNSKIAVYEHAKRIFSASRSSDPTLVGVKESLNAFCKRTRVTTRDSTLSGLALAIVLYITLSSFSVH